VDAGGKEVAFYNEVHDKLISMGPKSFSNQQIAMGMSGPQGATPAPAPPAGTVFSIRGATGGGKCMNGYYKQSGTFGGKPQYNKWNITKVGGKWEPGAVVKWETTDIVGKPGTAKWVTGCGGAHRYYIEVDNDRPPHTGWLARQGSAIGSFAVSYAGEQSEFHPGDGEKFMPVDAGGGSIALYNMVQKRFIQIRGNPPSLQAGGVKEATDQYGQLKKDMTGEILANEEFKILDIGYQKIDANFPDFYAKVTDVVELRQEVAELRAKTQQAMVLSRPRPPRGGEAQVLPHDHHPLGTLLAVRAAGGVKMYLPIGHVVAIYNSHTQRFVRMSDWAAISVSAKRTAENFNTSWTWERFVLVDAGGLDVALYSTASGRFLQMKAANPPTAAFTWLGASAEKPLDELAESDEMERFQPVEGGGDHIGFFSPKQKRFLSITTQSGKEEVGGSEQVMGPPVLPQMWLHARFKILDFNYYKANANYPYANTYDRVAKLRQELKRLRAQLTEAELLRGRAGNRSLENRSSAG
jgi:hypothetical protein